MSLRYRHDKTRRFLFLFQKETAGSRTKIIRKRIQCPLRPAVSTPLEQSPPPEKTCRAFLSERRSAASETYAAPKETVNFPEKHGADRGTANAAHKPKPL